MSATAQKATPAQVTPAPGAVEALRDSFPLLARRVYDQPLVYLDNAATTQKPGVVLDGLSAYYRRDNANVHRGIHFLSETATAAYEQAREQIRSLLNAAATREILFLRGTTEAINLVAWSYGGGCLRPGDEVLITEMEHHANIVPWQLLRDRQGIRLRWVSLDDRGELIQEEYERILGEGKVRLVALTHLSNALGTINPVQDMIKTAHAHNAVVLVDGAQALPHLEVDVRALDCDFYAFSGHKMFGPTGIGVLYGRERLLEQMPPWQGGGDMIKSVSMEQTRFNDLPYKFEAGTPHIAGAIGLGCAAQFLAGLDRGKVLRHEEQLLETALALCGEIPGLRVIGQARTRGAVLSFVQEGVHPHDLGTFLDRHGIAVRAGHHCCMPVMRRYGLAATTRASFALYNQVKEVEFLARTLHEARRFFA